MNDVAAVAYISLIFVAFAASHSLLVTDASKKFFASLFGELFVKTVYRFLFTCISLITISIAMILIARIPDKPLFIFPLWTKAIFFILQAIGVVIGILSFRIINLFEFVGIAQLISYLRHRSVSGDIEGIKANRLIRSGIYGFVRNPLYLAGILIVTFSPYVTRNSVTFALWADLYFIFGAAIEEKRLLHKFGDEYVRYMKKVPRLIPSLKKH